MTDLDALAASFEMMPGQTCSVCAFIEGQADSAQWDALLNGRRDASAVHRVMLQFGYRRSAQPVRKHRLEGHRR